jgi:competence protein ComEC
MTTRVLAAVLAVALLTTPSTAWPDHLVVRRPAVIRDAPSRNSARVSSAQPGATLPLAQEDLANGYYGVTDPDSGRRGWIYKTFVRRYPGNAEPSPKKPAAGPPATLNCAAKRPLRVRFYDVGQALAALVELPDGRNILVDAGEGPTRAGCGSVCRARHEHLLERLEHDLNGSAIALLWITHQHSDHVGGAVGILSRFPVEVFADNGESLGKTLITRVRETARRTGAKVVSITPVHAGAPIPGNGSALKIRSVVPAAWPVDCEEDANSCSIGLRIEYCASSVLFTGDAEDVEESDLAVHGAVTLLQVGHHGSETSSSEAFLRKVSPRYAVISAGRPGEGLNSTYCHPRQPSVDALTTTLGGSGSLTLTAFDGTVSCTKADATHWRRVRVSDRLWSTSRDGDVTLVTTGDGVFVRELAETVENGVTTW